MNDAAAVPEKKAPARRGTAEAARWNRQFVVTVGLLAGFAVLVVAMMVFADGDDGVWQRRVYVFGAVQAIVFTAIGWLFGREVGRSTAEDARQDAAVAKQDAELARAEARKEAARAADAARQATEADGKVRAVRAAARSTGRGHGPQDVAHRRDGGVDLASFIDELLGRPDPD